MKNTENTQYPNCWGYYEHNEENNNASLNEYNNI